MTVQQSGFDAPAYWESRHREFAGDHRNVGDRGLSSERNYRLIATKASIVSNTLGRLGISRGAEVLDAGCGAGVLTAFLSSTGYKMSGVDVSETAIEAARKSVAARFAVGSLASRPFAEPFDAVLCLDVLFHVVDDADWRASVTNLYEMVKPGGVLVIIEYFPAAGTKSAEHCRWRQMSDYEGVLKPQKWAETFTFKYPGRKEQKTLIALRKPPRSIFSRLSSGLTAS